MIMDDRHFHSPFRNNDENSLGRLLNSLGSFFGDEETKIVIASILTDDRNKLLSLLPREEGERNDTVVVGVKLLRLCCVFDSVECAAGLVNELGYTLVNEVDDESGMSGLHTASDVHASRCVELLLKKRGRTDLKCGGDGGEGTRRRRRLQTPLQLSLSSTRMDVVWDVDDPIEDLLICLNQKDLTTIKLLAEKTTDIVEVANEIAKEGRPVPLAALLMVSADRIISSTVYDFLITETLSLGFQQTAVQQQKMRTAEAADLHNCEEEISCLSHKRKVFLREMELLQMFGAVAQCRCTNKKMTSPLIRASQEQDVSVLKLLLETDINVTEVDNEGNTALHWSVKTSMRKSSKQTNIIWLLLKHGARVGQKNILGLTALHIAAANGNLPALQILLIEDPDTVDAITELKETPLFFAVKNDHMNCVELLLQWGANTEVINLRRQRPIDFARSQDMRFMLNPRNIRSGIGAVPIQQKYNDLKEEFDPETCETFFSVLDELSQTCRRNCRKTEASKYFSGNVRAGAKSFYCHGEEELRKPIGQDGIKHIRASDIHRKIFVGGLPPMVDSDVLGKYFENFGSVEHAAVVKAQSGDQLLSRRFGFVTFKHEKSVAVAVQAHYVTIMGKLVEMKSVFPRNLLPSKPEEELQHHQQVIMVSPQLQTPLQANNLQQEKEEIRQEETPEHTSTTSAVASPISKKSCDSKDEVEDGRRQNLSWAEILLQGRKDDQAHCETPHSQPHISSRNKKEPPWLTKLKKWLPVHLEQVWKRYAETKSYYALSSLKTDFRSTFGLDLDHCSLGYPKLKDFMESLPAASGLCRVQTVSVRKDGPPTHAVILPSLPSLSISKPPQLLDVDPPPKKPKLLLHPCSSELVLQSAESHATPPCPPDAKLAQLTVRPDVLDVIQKLRPSQTPERAPVGKSNKVEDDDDDSEEYYKLLHDVLLLSYDDTISLASSRYIHQEESPFRNAAALSFPLENTCSSCAHYSRFLQFLGPDPLFHARPWIKD